MAHAWTADHPVDRDLVEAVIREQFPHLDEHEAVEVGGGWEHAVWRCGDVVFRFPHQDSSLRSGHDRSDALARLAPRLPLPVPEPLLRGRPTEAYPGHVVGYRWIAGTLPARLPLTLADRAGVAEPLAGFVKALHAVSAEQIGVTPEGERGSMAERTVYGRRRAEQLADTPFAALASRAADAMDPPPAECRDDERTVVHGDLHAGQVLLSDEHELVGVIDWDSLALGDPAFDLIMAWSFVPPSARERFWIRYGRREASDRARHLALSYGLALTAQGLETGDNAVRDEAVFSLRNALEES